jgi:uncharacterized protein (DUF58 family)
MNVPLHWRWSPFARRLLIVAGVALALAVLTRRPALVVAAAAPLAWLVLGGSRGSSHGAEPGTALVRAEYPLRCFEDETVDVHVAVSLPSPVASLRVRLMAGGAWQGERTEASGHDEARVELSAELTGLRWGRAPLGWVTVETWSRHGLRCASARVPAGPEVALFPHPAAVGGLPVGSTRYDRAGDHPAATPGAGVEFHGIRPFLPGDRPRRINWAQSSRRGTLYVNEARAERAVDVIVAVDVLADPGEPGRSSRDLALRGATGVAQAVLHAHDRVGLVAVGGRLRWLRPDVGERQFYRVAEAMLDVVDWESYLDPDVEAIPYPALPSGAHVIFFSPLQDERGITAARTLRMRGHPVTVLDVNVAQPPARTPVAELARRLWTTERAATRKRLADLGVTTASWDGVAPLDAVIAPVLRAGERAAR